MTHDTTTPTLADLVRARRGRRGKAYAQTKHGACWLIADIDPIRRAGGDGIGNSGADITYSLELRHYRDDTVRALVVRRAWHQNGAYSGGGTTRTRVAGVESARTVEDVISTLLSATDAYDEPVYSPMYEDDLTEALTDLGLPAALPAPDEAAQQVG